MSSTAFEILDTDALADLEQSARRRGEYVKVLEEFMASGAKAARVPLDSGAFSGKATSSVKTGFSNAIEKAKVEGATKDTVEVLVAKENVYLRRRDI